MNALLILALAVIAFFAVAWLVISTCLTVAVIRDLWRNVQLNRVARAEDRRWQRAEQDGHPLQLKTRFDRLWR